MAKEFDLKIFIYKIVFIGTLVVLVASIAKIFAYFNTGADELSMFSKTVNYQSVHQPTVQWDIDTDEISATLDEYEKEKISEAYKNAWYFYNQSVSQKTNIALEDHFTDSLENYIVKQFNEYDHSIKQLDFNHNIKLHLFSFDRQLIAFSDNYVPIVTQVFDATGSVLVNHIDTFNLDVVMILEDGKWKINELRMLEKIESEDALTHGINHPRTFFQELDGVNYYPQLSPWKEFWKNFDEDVIEEDLSIVQEIGFNSFRTFIPFSEVGGSKVSKSFLDNLSTLLTKAQSKNLNTVITLFDFPDHYEINHYAAHTNHLTQILEVLKKFDNVMVDLKNEPDLDFKNYDEHVVIMWLEVMLKHIRSIDANIPLTIGWSDIEFAPILHDQLDFVSFHLYGDVSDFENRYNRVRSIIKNKPIVCTEFGLSSYSPKYLPFIGNSEQDQSDHISKLRKSFKHLSIGQMVWNLYDYAELDNDIFGWKPWIKNSQKEMGLIDQTGRKKKAASVF